MPRTPHRRGRHPCPSARRQGPEWTPSSSWALRRACCRSSPAEGTAIEEERRRHVGVTCAREHLIISYASSSQRRRPSSPERPPASWTACGPNAHGIPRFPAAEPPVARSAPAVRRRLRPTTTRALSPCSRGNCGPMAPDRHERRPLITVFADATPVDIAVVSSPIQLAPQLSSHPRRVAPTSSKSMAALWHQFPPGGSLRPNSACPSRATQCSGIAHSCEHRHSGWRCQAWRRPRGSRGRRPDRVRARAQQRAESRSGSSVPLQLPVAASRREAPDPERVDDGPSRQRRRLVQDQALTPGIGRVRICAASAGQHRDRRPAPCYLQAGRARPPLPDRRR